MKKTRNSASSAKRESKQRANQAAQVAKVEAVTVEAVEAEETRAETAAAMPVAVEAENVGKVDAKAALKSTNVLKAYVKTERRGANVTIRLIAEAAASGDKNAINVLCALCDVPREAMYLLNIDKVRAAVNAYYPYYIETDARRISVKPAGVWYTTACEGEEMEDAAKRVTRGYIVTPVEDYLEQLIAAAKCRAKGIKPRRIEADAVYDYNKLSLEAKGITASEIKEAKVRKEYEAGTVNVWKKDRNGFHI